MEQFVDYAGVGFFAFLVAASVALVMWFIGSKITRFLGIENAGFVADFTVGAFSSTIFFCVMAILGRFLS